DFGIERRELDLQDMKFLRCGVPELRSLASVLTASEVDGINCDETEKVGIEIRCKLISKVETQELQQGTPMIDGGLLLHYIRGEAKYNILTNHGE
ncbi:hypothetical protein Hamer_G006203, partial [Homarus americanus]